MKDSKQDLTPKQQKIYNSRTEYRKWIKAYKKAYDNEQDTFKFNDDVWSTSFAKFVIQFNDLNDKSNAKKEKT